MAEHDAFELESAKLDGKITIHYSTSPHAASLIIKAECNDQYRIPATDYDDMDAYSKEKYEASTQKLNALREALGGQFDEVQSKQRADWGFKAVRTYVDITEDSDLNFHLNRLVREGFITQEQAQDVTNRLNPSKMQYLGRITPPEVKAIS